MWNKQILSFHKDRFQLTVPSPSKEMIAKASTISCFLNSFQHDNFNSAAPSAEYMRQWTRSALVQVMACRLIGTKPLP